MLQRREFLGSLLAAAITSAVCGGQKRRPNILLRSSWQTVNIGDIAHTPGILALLERHLPEADVVLWASGDLTDEIIRMERKRFPFLRVVKGSLGSDGNASSAELAQAIAESDFLLHGSGPMLVAERDVRAYVQHTGKPFGVYGITWSGGNEEQKSLLGQAAFIFFRDHVSLELARELGVACPVMEFGPDAAFACDLRHESAAESFLKQHGLEPSRFVCCIPRLRYTPYWLIKADRQVNPDRHARNEAMKEHDHAPLREAIMAVVRETGMRVLVCPEDMTQMQVGKEMIINRLPAEVLPSVVWREKFWLPDEAVSTYVRAAAVFGLEMHSPIMSIGNGTPALVGRFAEQTSKGFMWQDIGLGEWLFDMDQEEQVAKPTPTLLELLADPEQARRRVAQAQAVVRQRQEETMAVLRTQITVAE